jgi:hypothetical protein
VLDLDDPVSSLQASGKVLFALARLEVTTVRQLAALAPAQVTRARRISPRLRRRIQELRAAVLDRFAEVLADERSRATTVLVPTDVPVSPTPGADGTDSSGQPPPRLTLEDLVPLLLPPVSSRGPKGSTTPAVRMLLGLDPVPGSESMDWPTQTAVADALGVTRGRLGQIGPAVATGRPTPGQPARRRGRPCWRALGVG